MPQKSVQLKNFIKKLNKIKMIQFIILILDFLRKWLGEFVFSAYYLTHLGRGTFFCYSNLGFDIVTLVIFICLSVFYLILTIYFKKSIEEMKLKRPYLFLSYGIHFLFIAFFFYEHWKHPNLHFLVFSIFVYVMVELGLHIWMHFKKQ